MRMRAHSSSNFTYADADGNIVLYYNARIPSLPHEQTGDTAAVAVTVGDMWSELVPWESLPLYVNPPGGYVQQANDTPDYINLNVTLDRDTVAANLPEPRLRLRSQLSLDLLHNAPVMSLEEMLELKHSPRMLAAERMLDDLLAAIEASDDREELDEAHRVLAAWDRTAAAASRGGVLFARWFDSYEEVADTMVFREAWTAERPIETPTGVGSPGKAVAALRFSVQDMRAAGIALDAAWGDVHRVVRGDVDVPVSGCDGTLGCFRTLSFAETEDGRLAANRGDAWVLAVEFGDEPRGYSVLAYGQSRLDDSPYFDDQAAMFARGELKTVAWTDEEIAARAIRRYRPGVPTPPEPSPGASSADSPVAPHSSNLDPAAEPAPMSDDTMDLGAFSVSLAVKDLGASLAFYEKLGFRRLGGDAQQYLILANGTTVIGLFQGLFEGNILTFNPGFTPAGTALDDFTDIREIRNRLVEAGVALTSDLDPDGDGTASIAFVDPDGNAVLIDQHVPKPGS
jgi:acyl-homoserine-lactone acylase